MMRVKSLMMCLETVKRLSCRVKGRIGVVDPQQETRVARKAKCRQKQKMGYDQHTNTYKNCINTFKIEFFHKKILQFQEDIKTVR